MSFSYDNFIRPLTTSDRVLKIYGDDGIVVYTINPFSVKSISVYANNIRVNLHSEKIIIISFSSNNEAKLAIGKLRSSLDVLQNKAPLFISKEIEEYVKNNVFGPTGPQGDHGDPGPQGDPGYSSYDLWLGQGNVGSVETYLQSLVGTSGTSGVNGTSGVGGTSGSSGSSGTEGTSGTSGVDGTTGTSGTEGTSGTSGTEGSSGTSGTEGTSGTSGLADRYTGTSSTTIVIPTQGTKINFDTQTQLAFVPGQTVYLYNDLITNYYMLDDYVDDLNSVYILGEVDSYNRNTGSMSIVTIYPQPVGGTYSTWYLTLTGQIGQSGATGSSGTNGTSGTSGINGTSGTSGVNGSQGPSLVLSGNDFEYNNLGPGGSRCYYSPTLYDFTSSMQVIVRNPYYTMTGNVQSYSAGLICVLPEPGSSVVGGTGVEIVLSGYPGLSGSNGTSGTSGSFGTSGTSGSSGQNGGNAYAVSKYYFQTGNTGSSTGQFDVTGTSNFNSITGIYINATDFDGLDFGTYLQGILNSGKTIEMQIKKISDPSRYGIYRLNSATYSGGKLYASSLSILSSSSNAFESGGVVTYHISFMGVTSTTDLSLSGNLTVSGTSSLSGLTELAETSEVVLGSFAATASTVSYDFSTGAIWYHDSANTNYLADFINVPTTNNRALTATILINQGVTGYSPTSLKINGVSQTIKWAGGTYSVSTNKVDIVGFTFIRTGATWSQVLGQINSFS